MGHHGGVLPTRFTPPLPFRLAYTVLVGLLALGAADAAADVDYSLLRRTAAVLFLAFVGWLIVSVWTAAVLIHPDALEVRRFWPGRHRFDWARIAECRHGSVLSFVVLTSGRWVTLGWFTKPGQLQLAIEAAKLAERPDVGERPD
jgi:hypothetical protein